MNVFIGYSLKPPEHSLCIKMGKKLKYPKNPNNYVIKHKL